MQITSTNNCRPTVAGIHGNTETGAYSIALAGGYEVNIDLGECFTYTGEGKQTPIVHCLFVCAIHFNNEFSKYWQVLDSYIIYDVILIGGRDLKGTKANPKNLRTAPQSKNQTLTRGNIHYQLQASNVHL